jgi:hypothetical protein
MSQLDRNKTGLAAGLFLGGWHLVWSILVAVGWGQPLIDFILWMHMVHLQYVVGPFELKAAAVLVPLTALFGYALGWIFAAVWNVLHR